MSYPSIKLERAVERARKIYDIDPSGTSSVPADDLRAAWSFGAQSSNFPQTVNALKGYGILDTARPTASGAALTNAAIEYFDARDDADRAEAVRAFALSPPLLRDLWETWGTQEVPLAIAVRHLRTSKGLSDKAAKTVHGIYFANLHFAGLAVDVGGGVPPAEAAVQAPVAAAINGHAALRPADIQVSLAGERIRIVADVDAGGLRKLKGVLDKYEEILAILAQGHIP